MKRIPELLCVAVIAGGICFNISCYNQAAKSKYISINKAPGPYFAVSHATYLTTNWETISFTNNRVYQIGTVKSNWFIHLDYGQDAKNHQQKQVDMVSTELPIYPIRCGNIVTSISRAVWFGPNGTTTATITNVATNFLDGSDDWVMDESGKYIHVTRAY
jgi:hypothetical protein